MTLLELLIGTIVIMILLALIGFQLRGLVQKAKISAARATINGFALCLSMAKDDTGLYPKLLRDLKEAQPPACDGFSFKGWSGPYGGTLSLNDPWGNEYQYELSERTVFGPEVIERETGIPYNETFTFLATAGPGTLIIDNPGVTAGSIILNGEEVVSPHEFKHTTPVIIKSVTLLDSNTITITLQSKPGMTITIKLTAEMTSKEATFTLWSWGKDGDDEGSGKYDAEIIYGTY
jgi:type II secretory pathway pseudopilin PulG